MANKTGEILEYGFGGFGVAGTIDLNGAYLTQLDWDDDPLLYSRRKVNGKTRGGLHVCIPQFGADLRQLPAGATNQLQHGYARTERWHVPAVLASALLNNAATLIHEQEVGEYRGLGTELNFDVQAVGEAVALAVSTRLFNGSKKPMRAIPGLHPYFDLNGDATDLSNLVNDNSITEFARTASIYTGLHKVTITNVEGYEAFTYWSDNPGEFVCVEPNVKGASFTPDSRPSEIEIIPSGEVMNYVARFTFEKQ